MEKVIVLTGGGSAGHVTPNLALVEKLQQKGFQVHYMGTQNGIERQLVHGIPYHTIEAGKLRRYLSRENVRDVFKVLRGYRQAKKILKQLRPAVVFAKGGFVSVPVVYAAAKLGIPAILHESDYTPGLANRLCMKKAKKICLSFDVPEGRTEKSVLTGSPIREELLRGDRQAGLTSLGFNGAKPVLLIMGGSLGAKAVNDAVDSCIEPLLEKYDVVHLRGRGNLNAKLEHMPGYRQYEYVESELADIYAATDIALSRSGANCIFEFLAVGIPALLVPLPLSASRGDQLLNAEYFKKNGYADVLFQEDLSAQALQEGLDNVYQNRETFKKNMTGSVAHNGTENVLKIIDESV